MSDEQIDLLEWLVGHPLDAPEAVPAPDGAAAEPDLTLVRLTRTHPACNMHRFYSLELATSLFGERGVVRHWGRIGTSGRSRTDWYDEPHEAESAFEDLLRAKRRRGYAYKGDSHMATAWIGSPASTKMMAEPCQGLRPQAFKIW